MRAVWVFNLNGSRDFMTTSSAMQNPLKELRNTLRIIRRIGRRINFIMVYDAGDHLNVSDVETLHATSLPISTIVRIPFHERVGHFQIDIHHHDKYNTSISSGYAIGDS